MGEYDPVMKSIFHDIGVILLQKFLDSQIISLEVIPMEIPVIQDRKTDYLVKASIRSKESAEEGNDEEVLVHFEFQSFNHHQMAIRMLNYLSHVFFRHGVQDVIQIVIYFGRDPLDMTDNLHFHNAFTELHYRYTITDLSTYDANDFLSDNDPRAFVLAVLARTPDPRHVVREVLTRLKTKVPESTRSRYLLTLDVLAQLRPDLSGIIEEEVERLGLAVELERTISYRRGLEKGRLEGKREGIIKILKLRFNLDADQIGRVQQVLASITDLSKLDELEDLALTAMTFTDFMTRLTL